MTSTAKKDDYCEVFFVKNLRAFGSKFPIFLVATDVPLWANSHIVPYVAYKEAVTVIWRTENSKLYQSLGLTLSGWRYGC
jgi:hypothetical protein